MKYMGYVLLFSCVLTLLWYWPLLFHLYDPVSLEYPDTHLAYFIFDHYQRIVISGDWGNVLTLPMFYGYEKSLLFSEHLFGPALIVVPLSLIFKSTIAATNFFVLLVSVVSFLSMYVYARSVTRRVFPSMVASLIFAFSPYVTSRTPAQVNLYTILCIPLLFFALDRWIDKPTNGRALLFFILSIAQVITGQNYAVYLFVLLVLYGLLRLRFDLRAYVACVNRGAVLGMVLLVSIALSTAVLYGSVKGTSFIRPASLNEQFSTRPADILLSAPRDSTLYGWLRPWAERLMPTIVSYETLTEGSVFVGLLPLILLVIGVVVIVKHRKAGIVWIIMMLMSLALSFGPRIFLTDTYALPGLHGIVSQVYPLLGYFRAPERFAVFYYLFLALICSIGLKTLTERKSSFAAVIGIFFILGIIMEYHKVPLQFTTVGDDLRQIYKEMDQRDDMSVILELPIGNNIIQKPFARSILLDTHYLLWATLLHNKKLVNGYSGTVPRTYYDMASALSIHFPTKEKLEQLHTAGVKGIMVHRDEYQEAGDYERVLSDMEILGVRIIARTQETVLYDMASWGT